jgi:hypothetical protein
MSVYWNVIQGTTIKLCSFVANFMKLLTQYQAYPTLLTRLALQQICFNSTHHRTRYFLLELEPFLHQTHSKTDAHFKWNFISYDSSVSLTLIDLPLHFNMLQFTATQRAHHPQL